VVSGAHAVDRDVIVGAGRVDTIRQEIEPAPGHEITLSVDGMSCIEFGRAFLQTRPERIRATTPEKCLQEVWRIPKERARSIGNCLS